MASDTDLYHDGWHEADDGTLDFFAVDVARASTRTFRLSDLQACPHLILAPEHYRDDGSCRCDEGG